MRIGFGTVLVIVTVACAPEPVAPEPDVGREPDGGGFDAPPPLPTEESAGECSDGVDNDGDGTTDCADLACTVHAFCGPIADVPTTDAPATIDAGSDAALADAGMDAFVATSDSGFDAPLPGSDGGVDAGPADSGSPDAPLVVIDAGGGADAGNPRPPGTYDFVFLSVSGHCIFPDCTTVYNDEYLMRETTLGILAQPMVADGASVGLSAFTDNLYDEPPATTPPAVRGFLTLVALMEEIRDTLIADYDNPTRVIVVAHSHGTVWAHLALLVLEFEGAPLPVDALVDFDGVSLGWEGKPVAGIGGDGWSTKIAMYNAIPGSRPWPFAIENAADSWGIPGLPAEDSEDVIPDSVFFNLELQSNSLVITDTELNHRLDGSRRNIETWPRAESHSAIHSPTGVTVPAVRDRLAALYGL